MDRKTIELGHPTERGGFALVTVIMVMLVAAAVIGAGMTLGSNHVLVNQYHQRNDQLIAAADAGLELVRSKLNGNPDLYPDSGFATIEYGAHVSDGAGGYLPGVTRSLYVGPVGIATGQFGVFAGVVSVTQDAGGAKVVHRLMLTQESFAKFAYFTDIEPSSISFGGGDQIFGPVHTNDYLKIYSSGATFHDEARTAQTVQGASYGTFKKGYEEHVSPIPLPPTAELTKLAAYAQTGSTRFIGTTNGGEGQATTRIEFMALDLNNDGDNVDENEGFIRVYQSNDFRWLSGDLRDDTPEEDDWQTSQLCGHYHAGQVFRSASQHNAAVTAGADNDWRDALSGGTRRCLLGGSDSITGAFRANDGVGQWLQYPGAVSPVLAGRADANYLFPLSRSLNPNFKGVIYVEGKVVVSGRLRGRVTLAASSDIILADDLTYAMDPGQGTCVDLLGFFSGTDVVVGNNTINAPSQPWAGSPWYTFDDTSGEFIHGVVLALDQFRADAHNTGSTSAEACEGNPWGRGCLYLTGGIIQRQRGPVGTITSNDPLRGTGYVKRYSYDPCAAKSAPPYFPTTGHFIRGQRYADDPVGFSAAAFYAQHQNP